MQCVFDRLFLVFFLGKFGDQGNDDDHIILVCLPMKKAVQRQQNWSKSQWKSWHTDCFVSSISVSISSWINTKFWCVWRQQGLYVALQRGHFKISIQVNHWRKQLPKTQNRLCWCNRDSIRRTHTLSIVFFFQNTVLLYFCLSEISFRCGWLSSTVPAEKRVCKCRRRYNLAFSSTEN